MKALRRILQFLFGLQTLTLVINNCSISLASSNLSKFPIGTGRAGRGCPVHRRVGDSLYLDASASHRLVETPAGEARSAVVGGRRQRTLSADPGFRHFGARTTNPHSWTVFAIILHIP